LARRVRAPNSSLDCRISDRRGSEFRQQAELSIRRVPAHTPGCVRYSGGMRFGLRPLSAIALILSACGGDGGSNNGGEAKIVSFPAQPMSIHSGGSAQLAWMTSGVNGVDIEPIVGLQPPNGKTTVKPIATTTYTLKAKPPGGAEQTAQVTV